MPNWCSNELTVSGRPDEVKRFLDACMGLPAKYPPVYLENGKVLFDSPEYTEKQFCFNALIPTPEDVLALGYDAHKKLPAENMMIAILGQKTAPLDGYHWNIANWGTKWDIYGDGLTYDEIGWHEGCESITFGFDTAWSPPTAWLKTAIERFPSLEFILHYEEPGCFFAGDLIGEDGFLTDVRYSDEKCQELFRWDDEE